MNVRKQQKKKLVSHPSKCAKHLEMQPNIKIFHEILPLRELLEFKRGSAKQHSQLITSTPNKKVLQEKTDKKILL